MIWYNCHIEIWHQFLPTKKFWLHSLNTLSNYQIATARATDQAMLISLLTRAESGKRGEVKTFQNIGQH